MDPKPVPIVVAVPAPGQINGFHHLNVEANQPAPPPVGFFQRHRDLILTPILFSVIGLIYGAVRLVLLIADKQHHNHSYTFQCKPDSVVALDGSGQFHSVSQAIYEAPDNFTGKYYCIYIKAGVYKEHAVIDYHKTNIALVGDGMGKTVITFNGNNSTTVVTGYQFLAINLTLENTYGTKDAVALSSSSVQATFYRCTFVANVSTLHLVEGAQYFRDCVISGTNRLIFGNAKVVFQNCSIEVGDGYKGNVLISQERDAPWHDTGFVLHRCTIKPMNASTSLTRTTYLGSPGGRYSQVIILKSYLGKLINPVGWFSRDMKATRTVYFGEFNNTGPGADTLHRVRWPSFKLLNCSEASKFTVGSFFKNSGWLSATGLPIWLNL